MEIQCQSTDILLSIILYCLILNPLTDHIKLPQTCKNYLYSREKLRYQIYYHSRWHVLESGGAVHKDQPIKINTL